MDKHYYAHRPCPIVPKEKRDGDWRYQLMELPENELLEKVIAMSRERLIEWLAWNDVHGIFLDEDCRNEGLNPLEKEDAEICVFVVIMRSRPDWDGYMGNINVKEMDLVVATEV